MEGLTLQTFNWLTELDEHEAATFVSNCYIENFYEDTLSEIGSDKVTDMYDITVHVPLKVYKNLSEFSTITSKIEEAIRDIAEADSVYVRRIDWKARLKTESELQSDKRGEIISDFLSQEYVLKQIRLMNQSINNDSHLALGIAKELIETCCKSILKDKGIVYDKDWDIQKLVKETNRQINPILFEMSNSGVAQSAISKILGGLSNIVHGVTELRNSYGTGHGHDPSFKMLDDLYIRLAVTSASELVIFYLTVHNEEKKSAS